MAEVVAWFEIALSAIGSVLGVIFSLSICVALVAWQVYEYRALWPLNKRTWWLLKVSTPLVAFAIVFLALATFEIEGLGGLAVFYGGLFAALVSTPFAIVALARLWAVPAKLALLASGSVLATAWVAWLAVAGISNNASNIGVGDVTQRVEYLAFKHAAKNPDNADGLIALTAKDALRLPSGERVIHLAFSVAEGYRLYGMDVQTKRSYGGGRSDSWRNTLGSCVTSDAYHLTNVLDNGEAFNVRLKFHQGTPESMIEFVGEYQFPMTQASHLPWIKLDYDGQYLSSPIPLPAAWATVNDSGPGHTIQSLLPEHQREYFGIAPGNDCWSGPLAISGDFHGITQGLYIEEHYRKVFIELPVARSKIAPL